MEPSQGTLSADDLNIISASDASSYEKSPSSDRNLSGTEEMLTAGLAAADAAVPEGATDLIVNFISLECSEEELRAIFAEFGPLQSTKIVFDRRKAHHRGFGFVAYENPRDAMRACKSLDGFQLYEKELKVAFSQNQRCSGYVPPSHVVAERPRPKARRQHTQHAMHYYNQVPQFGNGANFGRQGRRPYSGNVSMNQSQINTHVPQQQPMHPYFAAPVGGMMQM